MAKRTGQKRRVRKRRRLKKRTWIPAALFMLSVFLLAAAEYVKGFADGYARYVYPLITGTVGRISGLVPASIAEIGLYLLILTLAGGTVYIFLSVIRGAWNRYRTLKTGKILLFTAIILWFLYAANCGINYKSTSFADRSGIRPRSYTAEELARVCAVLAEDVRNTETEVKRDQKGRMLFETDEKKSAVRAMQNLGEEYPEFKGYYPEPKGLIFPEFLSYQSLTGIYSPFTVEANYNNDMTAYNIPFTMCHELSHLKGFMQEQEANFIAWLACSRADSAEFRYSAALSGWLYASNLLWEYDGGTYEKLYESLPEQAKKDLKENSVFWSRYEGKIAEVSNRINDTYLKTNGQKDGVASYDKMVDMLVVYVLDIQGR